jgi:hypothetical protein
MPATISAENVYMSTQLAVSGAYGAIQAHAGALSGLLAMHSRDTATYKDMLLITVTCLVYSTYLAHQCHRYRFAHQLRGPTPLPCSFLRLALLAPALLLLLPLLLLQLLVEPVLLRVLLPGWLLV